MSRWHREGRGFDSLHTLYQPATAGSKNWICSIQSFGTEPWCKFFIGWLFFNPVFFKTEFDNLEFIVIVKFNEFKFFMSISIAVDKHWWYIAKAARICSRVYPSWGLQQHRRSWRMLKLCYLDHWIFAMIPLLGRARSLPRRATEGPSGNRVPSGREAWTREDGCNKDKKIFRCSL